MELSTCFSVVLVGTSHSCPIDNNRMTVNLHCRVGLESPNRHSYCTQLMLQILIASIDIFNLMNNGQPRSSNSC